MEKFRISGVPSRRGRLVGILRTAIRFVRGKDSV